MSKSPDDVIEQLSAFMDGELPEAEARFLLRRLEHDAGLREAWARMQLGAQCLHAQAWQPVAAGFAERVAAGIGAEPAAAARRPLLRWAVAASVAALALVMGPRMLQPTTAPAPAFAEAPAAAADEMRIASPASADLVAMRRTSPGPAPAASARDAADGPLVATTSSTSDRASPLPLSATAEASPSEFPLVETGEERRWPRSDLASAGSDPSIEAYLVRHNQMMASDGLGGFVPYVDVVSTPQAGSAPEATSSGNEGK